MRIAPLVSLFVVAAASPASARPVSTYVPLARHGAAKAPSAIPHAAPTILFLNHGGGTYRPGVDDASQNTSGILNGTYAIPAWNVSPEGWAAVMACSQTMFQRWNVQVTDVDPGATPHFEVVVAGRPEQAGFPTNYGGVAPMYSDCSVVPHAIVYAFAEVYGTNYQGICETVAQEFAHAVGLDHEYLCQDPMTYLYDCGPKSFQNVDAQCGEYSARACMCSATQNSVAMLDARLGIFVPNQPPAVGFTSPGDGATVAAGFTVDVAASDDNAVTHVDLAIDGVPVGSLAAAPYTFATDPALAAGAHTVTAAAYDDAGLAASAQIIVTVAATPTPSPDAGVDPVDPTVDASPDDHGADDADDGEYVSGGCSSGAELPGTIVAVIIVIGLIQLARRRRRAALEQPAFDVDSWYIDDEPADD